MKVSKDYFKSPEDIGKKPEDVTEWLMVNPPPVTSRLARQSGKFSFHPGEQGFIPLDKIARRAGEELIKIEIVVKDGENPTAEIRQQLGIMNIHHASLFPDPEGTAEFVNYEWPIIAPVAAAQSSQRRP